MEEDEMYSCGTEGEFEAETAAFVEFEDHEMTEKHGMPAERARNCA